MPGSVLNSGSRSAARRDGGHLKSSNGYSFTIALIVALGGFLMGFDASVISGVVGFIEVEFSLNKIQLGWSVSSLSLTATMGMLFSGPLSDRVGRRVVLKIAAVLFAVSAAASPNWLETFAPVNCANVTLLCNEGREFQPVNIES